MARDVKDHVLVCDTCQRTKASRQKGAGLLQPLPVPTHPWQHISMDFMTGLSQTASQHDAMLVFVDRCTKMVWIAACMETCTAVQAADLFLQHVYRNHGLPESIISDRDARFTSHFWQAVHKALGTQLPKPA